MYDEWTDLELTKGDHSILDRLNLSASRAVSANVLDDLCRQLNSQSSSLLSDTEVKWCMQVVCYALGLPFSSDYGTIRNAVRLYCDWLTCILNEPHPSVPRPLFDQPLYYSREIINHLHHLFLPRTDSLNSDVILRQAKECHHVLRCIQSLILDAKFTLQKELWPEVLRFLLSINDALLSPPFDQDDISDQLCERVISVLFELWIAACANGHFPSPSYWKTFRTLCHRWHHRVQLIDRWVKTLLIITARKLVHLYGEDYCKMQIAEEDQKLVPVDMKVELVVQTWYRMLHLIGNPVELVTNQTFENSPKFREFINKHGGESGILDPSDHPCLVHLPYCFYRAMSGIRYMVSGLLGESVECGFRGPDKVSKELNILINQGVTNAQTAPTNINPSQPPISIRAALGLGLSSSGSVKNKDAKANLPQKTTISLNQLSDSVIICAILKSSPLTLSRSITYPVKRPSVESLCKFFGDWLFSVANAKSDAIKKHPFEDALSQKSSGSQQSSDAENPLKSGGQAELRAFLENVSSINGFQAGKAEAVATLCKIFSFKESKEVLPDFLLAKFYTALLDTLSDNDSVVSGYLIFHAVNLFRVGLRGIELLIPHFLDCLDALCLESDKSKIHPSLTDVELRRSILHLLSSLICVPTYYGISSFMDVNRNTEQHTCIGLRPKIMRILLHELKIETDSQNLQVCIGLISLFCQACWLWECDAGTMHNEVYFREAVHSVVSPICESLCGKWNADFAVCIAAIDCLCSLTYVQPKQTTTTQNGPSMDEVVLYLCKFVEVQLSKPPPAHSRDLHSTVVAAFYCLETWLVSMPTLLRSDVCLQKVAEVIQLGVTGAKASSLENATDIVSKPASQRVHDAAEQLLHTLFNRVGISFGMCHAPEDEDYLVQTLTNEGCGNASTGNAKFFYVIVDNSFIFAVVNANCTNESPSCRLVLRSPFNHSTCWTFTFRHRQRDKEKPPDFVPRPIGEDKPKLVHPISAYFPPDVDKIEKCKIDTSIPELELSPELDKMKRLLKKTQQKNSSKDVSYENLDVKPEILGDRVDAAKLFLQTFGYFDIENGEAKCQILRSDANDFKHELKLLDACPSRFIQTLHVFYVKDGKTLAVDILQNGMELEHVSQQYREFLSKLGVGINVQTSNLWTGHWSTAYHNGADAGDYVNQSQDGKHFILDGLSHALYWASPLVEMTFLVPTIRSYKLANRSRARSSPRDSFDMRPFDASFINECAAVQSSFNSQSSLQPLYEMHERSSVDFGSLNAMTTSSTAIFSQQQQQQEISPDSSPLMEFKQKSARLKTVIKFNKRKISMPAAIGISSSNFKNILETTSEHEDDLSSSSSSAMLNLSSSYSHAGATGDFMAPHPIPPPRSKSVSHNDDSALLLNSSNRATSTKKRTYLYQDYRILIVWLECFEDYSRFPRDELLIVTDIGEDATTTSAQKHDCVYVLFISPMENGLCRVKLSMNASRLGIPHPLIDGVVLSADLLSAAVRQTALSIGMRRRLEQEGYAQPFVKRRQKIQEFGSKFAKNLSLPEFLSEILLLR